MTVTFKSSSGKIWKKELPANVVVDVSMSNRVPRLKDKVTNAIIKDVQLEGFDPLVESISNVRVEE